MKKFFVLFLLVAAMLPIGGMAQVSDRLGDIEAQIDLSCEVEKQPTKDVQDISVKLNRNLLESQYKGIVMLGPKFPDVYFSFRRLTYIDSVFLEITSSDGHELGLFGELGKNTFESGSQLTYTVKGGGGWFRDNAQKQVHCVVQSYLLNNH